MERQNLITIKGGKTGRLGSALISAGHAMLLQDPVFSVVVLE